MLTTQDIRDIYSRLSEDQTITRYAEAEVLAAVSEAEALQQEIDRHNDEVKEAHHKYIIENYGDFAYNYQTASKDGDPFEGLTVDSLAIQKRRKGRELFPITTWQKEMNRAKRQLFRNSKKFHNLT